MNGSLFAADDPALLIKQAIEIADIEKLNALLQAHPKSVSFALGLEWDDMGGTPLHWVSATAIHCVGAGEQSSRSPDLAAKFCKLAKVLRAHGAPCRKADGRSSACMYFDREMWQYWDGAELIEEMMRDAITAGEFDANAPLPNWYDSRRNGLLPLHVAWNLGNERASRVLIDAGADMDAPMAAMRTKHADVVSFASSRNPKRGLLVAAVVTEAVMKKSLAKSATASAASDISSNRRRLGL